MIIMTGNTLTAYSSILNSAGKSKDLQITMKKAANGYIFLLTGEKEVPPPKDKDMYWDRWERFDATFVYANLDDGLKECAGFFQEMENVLNKRVEARTK